LLLLGIYVELRWLGHHQGDVVKHLTGFHHMRVVPCVGSTILVDEELLKVPGDVSHSHRLVEEVMTFGELSEGRPTSTLKEGVERYLVLAVDLDLLEHVVYSGHEAATRPHVLNAVEQFFRRAVRLLLAELVAGVAENDETLVLLSECIYLSVRGRGEASVGGHVEDQHGPSFELVERHSLIAVDGRRVEGVDGPVRGVLALHPARDRCAGEPQ